MSNHEVTKSSLQATQDELVEVHKKLEEMVDQHRQDMDTLKGKVGYESRKYLWETKDS